MRILAIACVLLLASCASNRAFYDFDEEQSFDDYKQFTWIAGEKSLVVMGERQPSPLIADALRSATIFALEEKGFVFVDGGTQADFAVQITVGSRDGIDVREVNVVEFYGPHWRWGFDYFNVMTVERQETIQREYTEGMLAIDIFDVDDKRPVWHGAGSKRLSREELRGQSVESSRAAVQTILANFPPPAPAS